MEKVRYSIIMPYYDRANQLFNTLLSFRHWYHDRDDYEVIIIEDIKNRKNNVEHKKLLDILKSYPDLPLRCYVNHVLSYNPSTHFNFGFDLAVGDFLIITNPEILHKADILGGLDECASEGTYIVCSCVRTQRGKLLPRFKSYNDITYKFEQWLQHTEHLNSMFHWCTCIHINDYSRIGGFDQRYSKGFAWEDADFINTIKLSNIEIICRDDLITVHQFHEKFILKKKELFERNKQLYRKKWQSNTA